ncbi:MAG TPA: MurR/RpiR family transcriptional regulator [Xanthobacteraceae bacterium]|jgi:DNA-binding MurR/RpiR family transcriptional regulator
MTAAPGTYEELREAISRRHDELSDRLRRIAVFAVEQPNDIALNTVSALATVIGVQPSSIVRFANAFGYEGFSDMQRVFRSRLVAEVSPGYRARFAATRSSKRRALDTDASSVLMREVADDTAALEELGRSIEPRLIQRAVEMLANAQTIYLVAQGRSFPVAHYLAYALGRLELRTHLIDGIGGLTRIVGAMSTSDDVMIAVSFRDYSPDVVAVADAAAVRGVPIVAITDGPLSPIAGPAKISFEIRSEPDRAFRSLVAPVALAQTIVITLGHHVTGGRSRS